jgi:hypothetical protein
MTAHGPQVSVIISYYALLGREPPESTAELLGAWTGVLLSSTSQLARRPAGTLDNEFTLFAHEDVFCA